MDFYQPHFFGVFDADDAEGVEGVCVGWMEYVVSAGEGLDVEEIAYFDAFDWRFGVDDYSVAVFNEK